MLITAKKECANPTIKSQTTSKMSMLAEHVDIAGELYVPVSACVTMSENLVDGLPAIP